MTLTPTQRLLYDIYRTDGPVVRLEARLNARGAVEDLSVLVYDRTLAQTLVLRLPLDGDAATLAEITEAAELWTLLMDGNGSDCQHH